MAVEVKMRSVPKPPAALLDGFRGIATSIISDNLARLPGATGLRPFHRGGYLIGPAFTVQTAAGDNLAIHQALALVEPGDVIVVDGGGDCSRALVGEIMKTIAEHRGAAGYVIDGAIRDSGAFAASDFDGAASRSTASAAVAQPLHGRLPSYPSEAPQHAIDQAFLINGALRCEHIWIGDSLASDHRPLVVKLTDHSGK